jgi:hypothetical protein
MRTIVGACGVESISPLFDRRILELVANASPAQRSGHGEDKALLREAAALRLPASVARRRKDQRPFVNERSRALQSQESERLVERGMTVAAVSDWIDPVSLRYHLATARLDEITHENDCLAAALATIRWIERLQFEFGGFT